MKPLNLIFATDQNYLFGKDGKLPWSCPEDLKHFNRITFNTFETNFLVMGRKTFESLPKKLDGRLHVVLSSKPVNAADYTYPSLHEFLNDNSLPRYDNIYVIGGAKLIESVFYNYFPLIKYVYYSRIEMKVDVEDGLYLNKNIIDIFYRYPYKINCFKDVTMYRFELPRHEEYQYLDLLKDCVYNGEMRNTRNGYTYSLFNKTISFDLNKGFPLLTTKAVFMRGIVEELLFFLKGETNSKILEEKNVNIWKPNTTEEFIKRTGLPYKEGDMGCMYGWQWKHFGTEYIDCETDYKDTGFNQIEYVLDLLEKDPTSRRILMTVYNPAQAKQGVLYPCHSIVIQFYCTEDLRVSMNMYQRSVDLACGLPFNIASNALLLSMICQTLKHRTGKTYTPDMLNIILGDIHIYEQHLDGIRQQLKRVPYEFPYLQLNKSYKNLEQYKYEDIEVKEYKSHPSIKYQMVA